MVAMESVRACANCGAQFSRYNPAELCAKCSRSGSASKPVEPPQSIPSPRKAWLYVGRTAVAPPDCSNVGDLFRAYRATNNLTQGDLAAALEHGRRSGERDEERMRAELSDRRAAYVELFAAVRAFRRTIRTHVLEPQQTRAELELARAAFDRRHAESQLIARKAVLQVATSVATALVAAYHSAVDAHGRVPDGGTDDVAQERAALLADLDGPVRDETARLRAVIRRDLGMSEQEA